MQKASLIAHIQTEHQNLENTLAKLNPEQLEIPGAIGFWSIKDTLAHIAVWQRRLTDWLLAYTAGTELNSPPPYGLDDKALAQLNDQFYLENQTKSSSEVLGFFRSTYQRTLKAIQGTPEEVFGQAISSPEQNGPQLWEIVAANTFEHDKEHDDDILAWLNSKLE